MKICYIAAPLSAPTRAEMDLNRARAARWVAWAARQGVAPVATWIVLSGELSETQENRELGLAIDCSTVERCDEVWLVAGKVTDGMRRESSHARRILDLTPLGPEPLDFDLNRPLFWRKVAPNHFRLLIVDGDFVPTPAEKIPCVLEGLPDADWQLADDEREF